MLAYRNPLGVLGTFYLQIVDFTKQRIINIILGQSHAVCVFYDLGNNSKLDKNFT